MKNTNSKMNGFQQKCSRPLVLCHHGSPCLYRRREGIPVPRKEESDSSRRQSIVYIHPGSFSVKGRKKINRQEIYYIYVIRNHLMSNHSQLGMRSLLLIPLRSQIYAAASDPHRRKAFFIEPPIFQSYWNLPSGNI